MVFTNFLGLLTNYPEILLALASFFFISYLLKHKNQVLVQWPILGTVPSILFNSTCLHDWFTEVLKGSRGTVLLRGPWFTKTDAFLTCDPANVHHILVTNFTNYPKGPEYSEKFDVLGDGIFNSDSTSWMIQRRMAQAHMSSNAFRQCLARTSREMVEKRLMPTLEHACDEGRIVDLQDVMLRFTFDNACALIFGVEPRCLSIDFPVVPFAKAIDDVEEAIVFRYIVPGKLWKLLRWMKIGKERKLVKAKETIDKFISQCISVKLEELKRVPKEIREKNEAEKGKDLLTSYMDSTLSEPEMEGLKYFKFLRDTTLNLLIAGRDTTSASLTWFFWLVAKNPSVETKIIEELRTKCQHVESRKLVGFETSDLCGLVYLHAALCESLRLYPPLPIDQKGVLRPDVLPSGDAIKPGEMIMYSIYAMGRMEWIWGEDCLEFKPERWITKENELKFEPPNKFIAFNAGPRSCLGKDIAFTQMKAVASAVLYNFHVQVVEGHQVSPNTSVMLFMKHGLKVRLIKRQ
ncbi:hypothetical protein Syun_010803 [Stephania yunnanensis]|uniref:Cytochrome P450 n=1 Tax=Stephania yunnanensis TaxID=152371 RepID=A0AAP0KIY5_9MAGN